jgi:heme oxygenase (mycobilin-producing)
MHLRPDLDESARLPAALDLEFPSRSHTDQGGFVALSRFEVAEGEDPLGSSHIDRVKQAFRERPHLVDNAPGFQRLDVFSPRSNPNEIWLLTFWDDEASYRVWHKSHEYHESHKGIPKGIRLVPRSTKLEFFDLIAS